MARRKYRREKLYPHLVGTHIDADTYAAIDHITQCHDVSLSSVVRDCIRMGLPDVRLMYQRQEQVDNARLAGM